MNSEVTPSGFQSQFIRTRPGWTYWVRRYDFIFVTLAILVGYAVFLLPGKGTGPLFWWLSILCFILLVLVWSANVLVDGDKPDWFKGIVAFGLVATFGWLFYLYSGTKWEVVGRMFFNIDKLNGVWPILWQGVTVTLQLAFGSAIFSVIIGLVVAVLRTFGNPTLNLFLIAYLDFFRSIPMIVLMVVIYYALPYLGISFESIVAATLALSLGYGAYAAEAFRAGIESIHFGQIEAARALGLSKLQTMRLVIVPQAIKVVIPPLTGILVSMLKDTAVASVIASPELLKRAKEAYIGKANATPLIASAVIYLIILIPMVRLANILERRIKKTR